MKSPKQQLRELAKSLSVTIHCGEKVELVSDPRHIGVVVAVLADTVLVQWDETTWKSYEQPEAIRRMK